MATKGTGYTKDTTDIRNGLSITCVRMSDSYRTSIRDMPQDQ